MLPFCKLGLLILHFEQYALSFFEEAVYRVSDHVESKVVLVKSTRFRLLGFQVVKFGQRIPLVDFQDGLEKHISLPL